MSIHELYMEIDIAEVDEIFKKLEQARETIRDCYFELRNLGVLTMKESESASDN